MEFPQGGNSYRTVRYSQLGGVDFSRPEYDVDRRRSSWAPNMISDNGKSPVKRAGWKTACTIEAPILGMWHTKIKGVKNFLVHGGTKIYKLNDVNGVLTAEILRSGVSGVGGCGFFARKDKEDGFYILTGAEYLYFDGTKIIDVCDIATVPITTIGRAPSGGGTSYNDINLLTGKRIEQFRGDGSAKVYQLAQTGISSIIKIEEIDSKLNRVEVPSSGYSVNIATGAVTFTTAHPTQITGEDNIFITYEKNIEGYKNKILKCSQFSHFGVGGNNRVFLTGNSELPAYDFWSDVYDPTYFPDLKYAIVGNTNQKILGYLKASDALAIVKEDNTTDTAIFLRSGSMAADNDALFTIKPSTLGIGAVSQNCFGVLNDDPLFLSKNGIYALSLNNMGTEKVTRNRSANLDVNLCKEQNLKNAVSCIWNSYYIVAVNGNCYILDGRQKIGTSNSESNFQYEGYHWTNVPAVCLCVETLENDTQDKLWFGTATGDIRYFKFGTDDIETYSDDKAAILAEWNTFSDDDGMLEKYKTMQRKGCLISLKPFRYGNVKCYISADSKTDALVKEENVDTSTLFEEINFNRFAFNGEDSPCEVFLRTKVRKYKRLQMKFVSDGVGEGFGIHEIVKTFQVMDFAKK